MKLFFVFLSVLVAKVSKKEPRLPSGAMLEKQTQHETVF
jgi:hypothetical protein